MKNGMDTSTLPPQQLEIMASLSGKDADENGNRNAR